MPVFTTIKGYTLIFYHESLFVLPDLIDLDAKQIQYSVANTALYIIFEQKLDAENDAIVLCDSVFDNNQQLFEIKSDKMPIVIYYIKHKFTTRNILLKKKSGDFFLFSDGFVD